MLTSVRANRRPVTGHAAQRQLSNKLKGVMLSPWPRAVNGSSFVQLMCP